MERLHVHFQDGFADDTVVVRVGEEMRQLTGITTSLLLGFATTLELPVPAGRVSVALDVPTRNLTRTLHLDIPTQCHLGISLIDDDIDTITADRPFGYA